MSFKQMSIHNIVGPLNGYMEGNVFKCISTIWTSVPSIHFN